MYEMFATGAGPDVTTTAGEPVTTGVVYVDEPTVSDGVFDVTV